MTKHDLTEIEQLIHNVRGPLNSISMNAELGKMYVMEGKASESVISTLDTIVRQCTACSAKLEALYVYLVAAERT